MRHLRSQSLHIQRSVPIVLSRPRCHILIYISRCPNDQINTGDACSHHISIFNIYKRHYLFLGLVEARTDDRSSSLSVSPPANVSVNISLAFLRLDGRVEGVLSAPTLPPPRLVLPLLEPPLPEELPWVCKEEGGEGVAAIQSAWPLESRGADSQGVASQAGAISEVGAENIN